MNYRMDPYSEISNISKHASKQAKVLVAFVHGLHTYVLTRVSPCFSWVASEFDLCSGVHKQYFRMCDKCPAVPVSMIFRPTEGFV